VNEYFNTLGAILGRFWQYFPQAAAVVTAGVILTTLVMLLGQAMLTAVSLWSRFGRFNFRDTLTYAYLIGAYERYKLGDAFGRTHEGSQDWNEAYDRGANLIDRITEEKT
jgi:hypothetical protein